MAVYKVPQDVEADDKLIGPFSFRQFIYLIVVAISMAGAWGLSQIFIPLAIIPLPFIIFFAALALPLRKDQPMEAYLSAVVSYYFLKSHRRFWQPDGIDSFVTIIPPKDADKILTKELDETEATKRLGFLANVVDTHGWSVRGASSTPDTSLNKDLYYEAREAKDVMQENSTTAQVLKQKLDSAAASQKTKAQTGMKTAAKQAAQGSDKQQKQSAGGKSDSPAPYTLPSVKEIKAKEATAVRKRNEEHAREALTYANFLAEEAGSTERATPQAPPDQAKTADVNDGMIELTQDQAQQLGSIREWRVQTISDQAKRVAAQNKSLKEGEEVVISLH